MPTDLTRRPMMEFAVLRERFDRFFDEILHTRGTDAAWRIAMDVQRTDDALVVRADVPGLEPDEVKITVEDGMLTVTGEHEESSSEETDAGYVRRERRYGAFRRTMALPPEAAADKIAASAKNGVVEITIPLGEKPSEETIEITPTAG